MEPKPHTTQVSGEKVLGLSEPVALQVLLEGETCLPSSLPSTTPGIN
jgi:hypothetical protein